MTFRELCGDTSEQPPTGSITTCRVNQTTSAELAKLFTPVPFIETIVLTRLEELRANCLDKIVGPNIWSEVAFPGNQWRRLNHSERLAVNTFFQNRWNRMNAPRASLYDYVMGLPSDSKKVTTES